MQLTDEMTTVIISLIPKFLLIEFMWDKTDERKKLRDLRKFKPKCLQTLNNYTYYLMWKPPC